MTNGIEVTQCEAHINAVFPAWCPSWLKIMVEEPNCTSGTPPDAARTGLLVNRLHAA